MSVFYLGLFYSYRLLVGIPSLMLSIWGLYFFLDNKGSTKRVVWGGIILGVATLIRYSPVLIFGSIVLIYLIVENKNIIKMKYKVNNAIPSARFISP